MKSMAKVKKSGLVLAVCLILFAASFTVKAADRELAMQKGKTERISLKAKAGELEFDKDKLSVRQTNGNRLIVKAKALGQANLTFRSGGRQYRYTIWITARQKFSEQKVKGVYADNIIYRKSKVYYDTVHWHPVQGADGYVVYVRQSGKWKQIKKVYGGNRNYFRYASKSKRNVYRVKAFQKGRNRVVFSKANGVFKRLL